MNFGFNCWVTARIHDFATDNVNNLSHNALDLSFKDKFKDKSKTKFCAVITSLETKKPPP
ncbi:hypothetical protein TUM3792_14110 [Shewanella sp. MBTL60-007]|nr:hypothetical protein TUM3792_14110 [Shewanella sp. MBTL60-007]